METEGNDKDFREGRGLPTKHTKHAKRREDHKPRITPTHTDEIELSRVDRGFEVDDVFAGAGVAEAFAGEALDGDGVFHGAQGSVQPAGGLGFDGDFAVEGELVLAEALVFEDDGLIPEADAEEGGEHEEGERETAQIIPNAVVAACHGNELSTTAVKKEDFL